MENSEKRPRANPKPPKLNEDNDLLRKLLVIEIERLETATKIEKERGIVFPETTVIIRDILKLKNALEKQDTESTTQEPKAIKRKLDIDDNQGFV